MYVCMYVCMYVYIYIYIYIYTHTYIYHFQHVAKVRSFGNNIYTGKINIDETERDQSNLLEKLAEFNNKFRPKTKGGKDTERIFLIVSELFMKV